jgi:hypothetical protein
MEAQQLTTRILAIVLGCLAFFLPAMSFAQSLRPHLEEYEDHWFFSALTKHAGYPRLFYQVCNRSTGNSAFNWQGAGFGVRAFAELAPDFCAFKNTYTQYSASPKPHSVHFQGKYPGQVMTWSIDRQSGFAQAVYSSVEATVFGPDGFVEHSMISLDVRIVDGIATLVITSSGSFSDVVIEFPESEVDALKLLDFVDGDVEVANLPLSSLGVSEVFDLSLGDSSSTALLLTPSGSIDVEQPTAFTLSLKTGTISELGGSANVFGRVGEETVIYSQVALPSVGQ